MSTEAVKPSAASCPAEQAVQTGGAVCTPCTPVAEAGPTCRICYASNPTDDLVVPCGCKGSHRFCHLECLRSWQEMMQAGNYPQRARECTICNTEYKFAPLAEPMHKWAWRQVAVPLNAVLQGCMTPFQFISCVLVVAVVSFLAGFLSTSFMQAQQYTKGGIALAGGAMLDTTTWETAMSSAMLLGTFFVMMAGVLWALIIPGFQAVSISAAVTLAVAAAATSHTAAYSALAVVSLGTALSEAECLDWLCDQSMKLVKLVVPPTVITMPKFMRVADVQ